MKLARLALVAAAALAAVAFAGVLQPSGAVGQAADPTDGGLTVLGTGSASVTPDRATFTFGTVSQGQNRSRRARRELRGGHARRRRRCGAPESRAPTSRRPRSRSRRAGTRRATRSSATRRRTA